MKPSLALILGFTLVALPASAQSKSDQAQIVSTAEIMKIDAKKKSLQVRDLVEASATGRRGGGGRGAGRGGGGGGRRGGGGVGFPGGGGGRTGGGGPRYPGGGGGGASTNQVKEYKVFVSKDTVMKLAETNIDFTDLHVGDRIIISGTPKGSKGDVDATSITRTFQ